MAASSVNAAARGLTDPATWPAGRLVLLGLAALVLCFCLAAASGPNVGEVTSTECGQAETTVKQSLTEADAANDRAGILRLVRVMPGETEPGRNICVLVAGVVSRETVEERGNDVKLMQEALTASEARLTKATDEGKPASEITMFQSAVDKARTDLRTAKAAYAKPLDPVPLSVFLNDKLAPFLKVQAHATDAVQRLYFPLWTPDNATDPAAKFWQELLSEVAFAKPLGKRQVDIGLSHAGSTASIPETARNGTIDQITMYVFSLSPVLVGLFALALLTAAFIGYAARTPLLRDNSLTCRDLLDRLKAVRLEEKRLQREFDLAETDLAAAPGDPDKFAAYTAARSAFVAARAENGRLETVLDVDPAHRNARVQRMRLEDLLIKPQEEVARLRARRNTAQAALDAAGKTFDEVSGLAAAQAAVDQAEAALTASPPGASPQGRDDAKAARDRIVSTNETLMKATEAELETAGTDIKEAVSGVRQKQAGIDQVTQQLKDSEKALDDAQLAVGPAASKVADIQRNYPTSQFADRAIGPYSLGRTQMAFWLFLVIAGYVFIAMSFDLYYGLLSNEILWLLGISGATGLGSVLINAGTTEGRTSRGFVSDVLSVDGAPQLQRIQAIAWTLILGALFVWTVARNFRLPVFDPTLLLLMGLVSGLYLGFKAQEEAKGEAAKGDAANNGSKSGGTP
ncbi:hypothetical protein E0H36_25870 [Rhizobium leguminosarum bv. viciae]|uniref:Uncharacterized protein n=1 Tax=Rhizobium leguminosarum TaxID=384 RepID=A0A6P0AYQ2_RHILE|nr:hypothetical protein [Rhizobium leguminosarum]MBY5487122.1 hypothetical protein [Rhizobium leguminosarum]NEI32535.1 hypothetical protein [Rhizobium leguminosarum]NEI39294.1 hypothetical protein [Rhizobium leguminosarum]TBZ28689.1 hypothetical protein E0H36_25870 [Rhizobium leguminosarum bv. viciae]